MKEERHMKYPMYELIEKKKHGKVLTEDEIRDMILAYTAGEVPDYQMSAMLMAIWFKGMTDKETADLTLAMADSGDKLDLSVIKGTKLDKHSTGGIGDKTSLIVMPVLAALGVPTAKMSGRGLGFTGGTIDKLESIPGLRSEFSEEEFKDIVQKIGFIDAAQTAELAPADKLLYALRDVTATIDSIPLIASSIMSKKLAAGADRIVLDVKCGTGAFMQDVDSARELARQMIRIGDLTGRKVVAVLSDMNEPLGHAVGNRLEVMEALEVLSGGGEERLRHLCEKISTEMLQLSDQARPTPEEAGKAVREVLDSGKALELFRTYVTVAGGDVSFLDDLKPRAEYQEEVKADSDGYLVCRNASEVGLISVLLGAGRAKKGDPIDPEAGIWFHKKPGDAISKGDVIATVYTGKKEALPEAVRRLKEVCPVRPEREAGRPVIYEILR